MINVIIADHQSIFRAGIAKVLAVEEDMRIVGQPQLPEQLLNCLEKLKSRVLILSSHFSLEIFELLQAATQRAISILILAENSESASDLMLLGVQGVIFRCASGNVVVEAVRRLSRGENYVQGFLSSAAEQSEDLVGARVRDRLNDRELRILAAVVQGYKNKDIAGQLYTTEQVIKNSLRNIFDKIGVSDRLELALFVLHHRMLAQAMAAVAAADRNSTRAQAAEYSLERLRIPPTVN